MRLRRKSRLRRKRMINCQRSSGLESLDVLNYVVVVDGVVARTEGSMGAEVEEREDSWKVR